MRLLAAGGGKLHALHLPLHLLPVGLLRRQQIAVAVAADGVGPVGERVGLPRQHDSLPPAYLGHRRAEVVSQDAPRHTVDGNVVTHHQQAVAIVGVQQRGSQDGAVLQVYQRCLARCGSSHGRCHVLLAWQRLLLECH